MEIVSLYLDLYQTAELQHYRYKAINKPKDGDELMD